MAVSYENLPGAGSAPRGVDHPNVLDLRVPGPLDATMPPTPIRELLAASGATLFVLATDANFISTIRRAAEQHPLFVVETWPELLEAVDAGRCGIALLDATLLGPRVSQSVARLAAYHDRLVTLVAADRTAAQEYIGLLSGGRIHRLLIKPVAIGAARLLIESATARRLQLRDEAAKPGRPTPLRWCRLACRNGFGAPQPESAPSRCSESRSPAPGSTGGTARPQSDSAAPDVAARARNPRRRRRTRLADLRAKASLALPGRPARRASRRQCPRSLSRRARARAQGPGGSRRLHGRHGRLFKRAEQALLADELEAAAMALDQVRRVDPRAAVSRFSMRSSPALWRCSPRRPGACRFGAARRGCLADGARQRAEPRQGAARPGADLGACRR